MPCRRRQTLTLKYEGFAGSWCSSKSHRWGAATMRLSSLLMHIDSTLSSATLQHLYLSDRRTNLPYQIGSAVCGRQVGRTPRFEGRPDRLQPAEGSDAAAAREVGSISATCQRRSGLLLHNYRSRRRSTMWVTRE